jgi:hypothetical protein
MNGKGSKSRPFGVSQEEFDNNWDKIFKSKPKTISRHHSHDGERTAYVNLTGTGFVVELYQSEIHIRTVDCSEKSMQWAEDVAENWALHIL